MVDGRKSHQSGGKNIWRENRMRKRYSFSRAKTIEHVAGVALLAFHLISLFTIRARWSSSRPASTMAMNGGTFQADPVLSKEENACTGIIQKYPTGSRVLKVREYVLRSFRRCLRLCTHSCIALTLYISLSNRVISSIGIHRNSRDMEHSMGL